MQQQTIQNAGGKDFNYPVEVADGRRLTISWNRGENPQEGRMKKGIWNHLKFRRLIDGADKTVFEDFEAPEHLKYQFVNVCDHLNFVSTCQPQEVALNFARQHGGIAANELPDIVNFISQAMKS